MTICKEYLHKKSVKSLKKFAKYRKLSGYSKLKKSDIIEIIRRNRASIIIQRFIRKKLAISDICAFTLEQFRYPCFGKRVKKGFFYSNLEDLANYLVTSGDFREPNTRIYYNKNELSQIEELVKYHKIKLPISIQTAISNKKYFQKKKCNDEQIDILIERIRFTCWSIRENIDNIIYEKESIDDIYITMDNIYLPEISTCMSILNMKSKQSLRVSILSSKRIIDDIPIDCTFIDKIKNHFYAFLIKEKIFYELNDFEL